MTTRHTHTPTHPHSSPSNHIYIYCIHYTSTNAQSHKWQWHKTCFWSIFGNVTWRQDGTLNGVWKSCMDRGKSDVAWGISRRSYSCILTHCWSVVLSSYLFPFHEHNAVQKPFLPLHIPFELNWTERTLLALRRSIITSPETGAVVQRCDDVH